jgi:hypothetical protein
MGSYASRFGEPPFDPRMMVALRPHGYACGLYSSRRIAQAKPSAPTIKRTAQRIPPRKIRPPRKSLGWRGISSSSSSMTVPMPDRMRHRD